LTVVFSVQVRQLAEAKQAELNAKILQLESHIHWLQRDNQRLQQEPKQAEDIRASSAGAPAQTAAASSELMVRVYFYNKLDSTST